TGGGSAVSGPVAKDGGRDGGAHAGQRAVPPAVQVLRRGQRPQEVARAVRAGASRLTRWYSATAPLATSTAPESWPRGRSWCVPVDGGGLHPLRAAGGGAADVQEDAGRRLRAARSGEGRD